MLTELAVGLGLPSAPGVANAVRPKPRDKFFTHGSKWIPRCPSHRAGTLSWQRTKQILAQSIMDATAIETPEVSEKKAELRA